MQSNRTTPSPAASNTPMTVVAVLLGFLVLDRIAAPSGSLGPSEASAQVRSVRSGGLNPEPTPPADARANPAEDRVQMIAELKNISQRLERLEATIAKGLSVKVTDMPEMKLPKSLEAKLNQGTGN
ncbi:MAG TPA: hypothetical protein VK176_13305 [Phycisphaerales bacterium]|nr:hypothetical protein [Phycisphaerales bacterium]